MPNIATFSSSAASPISALNILFQSLSKKDPISPEMLTTLEQINILEYAGFIPSK